MGGYKDDLEAAHERIRALERELKDARAEEEEGVEEGEREPPRPLGSVGAILLLSLPLLAAIGLMAARTPIFWPPAAMAVVALAAGLIVLRGHLLIARPCELLVIAGRQSGKNGYRIVAGGRTIRVPLVESTERLDLRAQRVDLSVSGHARGCRIQLRGYALLAPDFTEPGVRQFVERFLGRSREEIGAVGVEVLEAAARSVIAASDVSSAQELDRDETLAAITAEVEADLAKLGIELLGAGILELREVQG